MEQTPCLATGKGGTGPPARPSIGKDHGQHHDINPAQEAEKENIHAGGADQGDPARPRRERSGPPGDHPEGWHGRKPSRA